MITVTAANIQMLLGLADDVGKDGGSFGRAKSCTATFGLLEPNDGYCTFSTQCGASLNTWNQVIQFKNWPTIVDLTQLPNLAGNDQSQWQQIKQVFPSIINDDVQVDCSCPAFIWWGHHYNLNEKDTALTSQPYAPTTNDPYGLRVSCKHLIACYRLLYL